MMHFAKCAALVATFLPVSEAKLTLSVPTKNSDESDKKKKVNTYPLRVIEKNENQVSDPVDVKSIDLNLVGEVDMKRQELEAERGPPIDEDFLPPQPKGAPAATAKHEETIQPGMKKADPNKPQKSGAYNPFTGQVEASSFLQVKKSVDSDDADLEDTSADSDLEDTSAESDDADVQEQESDAEVTGDAAEYMDSDELQEDIDDASDDKIDQGLEAEDEASDAQKEELEDTEDMDEDDASLVNDDSEAEAKAETGDSEEAADSEAVADDEETEQAAEYEDSDELNEEQEEMQDQETDETGAEQ